jgi:site-specific DNA recombinase
VVVYLRISSDPDDERRGVTRQAEDAVSAVVDGDGVVVWEAVENDTSAFKKRRVRVSDGDGGYRWAWRVIRPKWEKALGMIRGGQADCLLVVDLDRLTRDPRDLEDAIELVEHFGALVADVTGALDLTTDHGVFLPG